MRAKGERLGPYELIAPIGAGGMGEVWKAQDTRLRRVVAVKFPNARFPRHFEREALAIASLNHPNVAQIYDVGDHYIVMEYVDGAPVRKLEDPRKVLDVATQIADGLAAAHAAGFVHRDLKPANVLLTRDGRVKILDFGIAKRTSDSLEDADADSPTLTAPGFIAGTAAYMSPEQARGEEVDFRTDQFSLGLVVYEMLSGRSPFRRPTAVETMTAIIREDAGALPQTTPAALCWTIERCLAKDREQRYDSTRDLFRELRQLRDHVTGSQTAIQSVSPPRGKTTRNLGIAAAVLILLVAGIGTAWLLANRKPQAPRWIGTRLGGPGIALRPAVSPDGRLLAFSAMVDGQTQLAVMDPKSRSWTVLTHDRNAGMEAQASWAPDGSRIYFDRVWGGPQGIYEISPLGGEPRLVLDGAQCPHTLPDGSLIVVRIDSSGHYRLYRFWPSSGKLQALPAFAEGGVAETPDPLVQTFPDGHYVVYLGTPADQPNGPPRWYVLNLTSLHSRLLDAKVVKLAFAVGVSPDSRSALLVQSIGDIWQIAAVPRSGKGDPRPLISFPKPSNIYGIDAARDGTIYFDYMNRPASILQYNPATKTPSNALTQMAAGGMTPFGAGSFLIQGIENGKGAVKVFRPSLGSQDLIESSEQSFMPAVRVGTGSIALRLGSEGKINIAIANLRDGQVIKRFRFDASAIRSIAALPDGSTLYFSDGGEIWSIATNADEGAKPVPVTKGASVAIDPSGKYLYVVRTRTEPRPLVRIPLAGGPAQTLAIPPQYTISDDPLSPAAVDASGQIVFEVDSPDSWFERIAMIDPSRKSFNLLPIHFSGDIWDPGWESNGQIAAIAAQLDSSLWRYKPSRNASQ